MKIHKKSLLLFAFIVLTTSLFAQNTDSDEDITECGQYKEPPEIIEEDLATDSTVFIFADTTATPQIGIGKFFKMIHEQITNPENPHHLTTHKKKVYVQFIVEKDGTLSNYKIRRGIRQDLDEEAIRIIKSVVAKTGKWKPAIRRGKAVRQRFAIPVTFRIPTAQK